MNLPWVSPVSIGSFSGDMRSEANQIKHAIQNKTIVPQSNLYVWPPLISVSDKTELAWCAISVRSLKDNEWMNILYLNMINIKAVNYLRGHVCIYIFSI